jgi:hypothetical protein
MRTYLGCIKQGFGVQHQRGGNLSDFLFDIECSVVLHGAATEAPARSLVVIDDNRIWKPLQTHQCAGTLTEELTNTNCKTKK